jgi:hypothetical protein
LTSVSGKGLDKGRFAAWRAPAAEEPAVPSTLLVHPIVTPAGRVFTGRPAPRPDALTDAAHWSSSSLPNRLNREWALLCADAAGQQAVRAWAAPGRGGAALRRLAGVDGLRGTVQLLQSAEVTAGDRDVLLVGLLERAQGGDRLAGRVVLQTMLPAAVRLALGITNRPDVLGDTDEAFALVLAALWQVIATYPVACRRAKVPANLYLDTLALVSRGHTSSTHRKALIFPEQSYADVRTAAEPGRLDPGQDDLAGPADAQLCTVLAWAVRSRVVSLDEARLLARVYGFDGDATESGPAIAAEQGLSWPTLRQRCHRLARRVGRAAVAAGFDSVVQPGAVLGAA